ncbi:MAG: hypothetical protein RSD88_05425 [Anaerovoracaceae bacterium]
MKGRKYLKVVGILLIIFSAISVVVSLFGMLGGGVLAVAGEDDAAIGGGVLIAIFGIALILAAFQLIVGIIGVKGCDKPEKAGLCFKLGIVLVVLVLISTISSIATAGFDGSIVVSTIIGLILPVLFCYGAKLNQQK